MLTSAFALLVALTGDTITTIELTIPGPVPLPAVLTLPDAPAPVPVVVIVHGSGPGDRHGTLGPNAPYDDLAAGLAERGIAVLRYDKRTRVKPLSFLGRPFTVRDEVIDDALAAITMLRSRPEIDGQRVILLGHSLGGFLAPRIAAEDRHLAGIILWAGAFREQVPELMMTQLDYIASVAGADSTRVRAQRDQVGIMVRQIAALTPADSASIAVIMGAPPAYWLDLRGYNPIATLKDLTLPVLIQQGGMDYQVTYPMLDGFLAELGPRPRLTVERYPTLNHLFMASTGTPRPAMYAVPGKVSFEVIEVMAAWIERIVAGRKT